MYITTTTTKNPQISVRICELVSYVCLFWYKKILLFQTHCFDYSLYCYL